MPKIETGRVALKKATRLAIEACGGADALHELHGFPSPQAIRRWYSDAEEHESVLMPLSWAPLLPSAAAREAIATAILGGTHVVTELPAADGDALAVVEVALGSAREHSEAVAATLALRHGSALTRSDIANARKEAGEAVKAAVVMHRAVLALDEQAQRDVVVAAPKLRRVG